MKYTDRVNFVKIENGRIMIILVKSNFYRELVVRINDIENQILKVGYWKY